MTELFIFLVPSCLPLARGSIFPVPLAVPVENSTPNWLASVVFLSWTSLSAIWLSCDPGQLDALPSYAIPKCQGQKICCGLRGRSKAIWAFGSSLFVLKAGSEAGDSVLSKRGFRSPSYLFLWWTGPCSCEACWPPWGQFYPLSSFFWNKLSVAGVKKK